MANNIYLWSTTAASNANVDGSDWSEGMNPGNVNNSARQDKASIAAFVKDIACGTVAGGSANAITLTSNAGFVTLADGLIVGFKASNNNSAATTLNVNAIGAKSVRLPNDTALVGGEIKDDLPYLCVYSEAANAAAGGWILINPSVIRTIVGNVTQTGNLVVSGTITVG